MCAVCCSRDGPDPAVPAVLGHAGGVRAGAGGLLPGRGQQLGPGHAGAGAGPRRGQQDAGCAGHRRH